MTHSRTLSIVMLHQRRKNSNLTLQILLQLAAILQLVLMLPGVNSQRNGDVKLVNGPTNYQGTVAIYYNNTWGTLCDDSWQYADAHVICKQLGFENASNIWYRAKYGPGPGPIWVDQIRCPPGMDHISKCTPTMDKWGNHDCSKSEDAGVDCKRRVPTKPEALPIRLSCPQHQQLGSCKTCSDKIHPTPQDCTVQAAVEGIVMAKYEGSWNPVSAEGFGMKEARIVCGELGFPLALGLPHLRELWRNWNGLYLQDCQSEQGSGEPTGRICTPQEVFENIQYRNKLKTTLLKNLSCVGNERRMLDCYFSDFGPHSNAVVQVATVRCGFKPHHSCPNSPTTEVLLFGLLLSL